MNIYLPLHYDAGNRGCEGIARGTAELLGVDKEHLFAYSHDIALDSSLGIDRVFHLVPFSRGSIVVDKFLGGINKIFNTPLTQQWRFLHPYKSFLKEIHKGDVMLSTGGDMMCYGNNEVVYSNNVLHRRGVKTILWGCSMGPENLTPEKRETLDKFSLIYARESLTYAFFKSLGLKNVCLYPDPAFILEPQKCKLPDCFSQDEVIGINISSFIIGGLSLDSPFGREVTNLIDHILKDTSSHILLVPHVTWKFPGQNQDDRELAHIIHKRFNNTERISILTMDNLNYCQIRYVISKCKIFIGARTHAVISAYSTCVPTIALGYSIKSHGIAKDLQLDSSLVVDSKNITPGALLGAFDYLMEHCDEVRNHLQNIMPDYRQSTYGVRERVKQILNQ